MSSAHVEVSDHDIVGLFLLAANRVSAVSLAIGYPAACAVPHMLVNSCKNLTAVAVETEIDFVHVKRIKEALKGPATGASQPGAPTLKATVRFKAHALTRTDTQKAGRVS